MAPEIESRDVREMAVECVIFDRAERPKRRKLVPLLRLLAEVGPREADTDGDA
jgi:hypothetical protein